MKTHILFLREPTARPESSELRRFYPQGHMRERARRFRLNPFPRARCSQENRDTDLSGENVLLSENFYYFGDKPVALPKKILALIHPTQGHKSRANDPYVGQFFEWIKCAGWKKNGVLGEPQLKKKILTITEGECRSSCSKRDKEEDQ